jgi:hypothetical protein
MRSRSCWCRAARANPRTMTRWASFVTPDWMRDRVDIEESTRYSELELGGRCELACLRCRVPASTCLAVRVRGNITRHRNKSAHRVTPRPSDHRPSNRLLDDNCSGWSVRTWVTASLCLACAWERHSPSRQQRLSGLLSTIRSSPIQPLLGDNRCAMRKGFDAALTKLKPRSALQAKDGTLRRLPRSTAFMGLQNALRLFQEIAGTTGVPGLQEGVKGLSILLDVIQVHLSCHLLLLNCLQMDL